jgi:hypothetical protein
MKDKDNFITFKTEQSQNTVDVEQIWFKDHPKLQMPLSYFNV